VSVAATASARLGVDRGEEERQRGEAEQQRRRVGGRAAELQHAQAVQQGERDPEGDERDEYTGEDRRAGEDREHPDELRIDREECDSAGGQSLVSGRCDAEVVAGVKAVGRRGEQVADRTQGAGLTLGHRRRVRGEGEGTDDPGDEHEQP
jgi:hypothetical protein